MKILNIMVLRGSGRSYTHGETFASTRIVEPERLDRRPCLCDIYGTWTQASCSRCYSSDIDAVHSALPCSMCMGRISAVWKFIVVRRYRLSLSVPGVPFPFRCSFIAYHHTSGQVHASTIKSIVTKTLSNTYGVCAAQYKIEASSSLLNDGTLSDIPSTRSVIVKMSGLLRSWRLVWSILKQRNDGQFPLFMNACSRGLYATLGSSEYPAPGINGNASPFLVYDVYSTPASVSSCVVTLS